MTNVEIKCALWIMQDGYVRMTPDCERPGVKHGNETCEHCMGTPLVKCKKHHDVVEICRRAQETLKSR